MIREALVRSANSDRTRIPLEIQSAKKRMAQYSKTETTASTESIVLGSLEIPNSKIERIERPLFWVSFGGPGTLQP